MALTTVQGFLPLSDQRQPTEGTLHPPVHIFLHCSYHILTRYLFNVCLCLPPQKKILRIITL